jgi:methylglutaconyl-CoA hydratase
MKGYDTLTCTESDRATVVTLNRPEVHNAFNETMLAELVDLLEKLDSATDVRVVVFTGAGKSFSAGADLTWMGRTIDYTREENLKDARMIARVFRMIDTLQKPVIAAINGAVIGGGMGFVVAADLVIASDRAEFGLPEVRLGIVPACISPYLLHKAGGSAIKELFLTGARFTAERALRLGLANEVVFHERLMDRVMERARELALGGPEAIAVCKRLLRELPETGLERIDSYTAEMLADVRVSAEGQEGMRAFLEKRAPRWRSAEDSVLAERDRDRP